MRLFSRGATRGLAFAAFFGSGAAGLIYEICWIRQASLSFGSTTFAMSSVLAVFFLGLALGSEFFGRVAQRTTNPLRPLLRIELALAAFGLASPYLFRLADGVFGVVYRSLEASEAGEPWLVLTRLALVAVVLLPPTVLMGGTLPLFCRQFVDSDARIANAVGWLYGLNTLGAAIGCAAAGLLFLPSLGLQGTVALAATLNLLVAGALVLCSQVLTAPALQARESQAGETPSSDVGRVHGLVFAAGFVAIGSEVLWARFLGLLVSNTTYTYTLTLTTVLIGIVLGSQLARRFDRVRDRAALFGWLQVTGALLILLLLLLPPEFWRALGGSRFWIYGLLLLPPAVVQGASFPLAVRLVVSDASRAGGGVGRLTAFNTLGGIAGSLFVGFVGLPLLGLHAMVLAITALGVGTGLAAWIGLEVRQAPRRRVVWAVVSLAAWLVIPPSTATRLPQDFLGQRGELIAFYEGKASNVSVVIRDGMNHLNIDRLWQGRNARGQQALAAHVPMLLHRDPRNV
ncbi:MAG: fused MFS/spermidine synthase, partial [Deltaproteobacteria bacterium]|nr:fused MFS/spermidine synthase [Deltaproteobacteria bacterium]